MSKTMKVSIITSLITAAVIGCVAPFVMDAVTGFYPYLTTYAVLYRLAQICGGIAQVATAITLPIIGTQVVQQLRKENEYECD